MPQTSKRVTPVSLRKMKKSGGKIVMVTAYDFPTAELLDAAGVDMILVGDSLASVIQGKKTTLSVTLDEMIYHTELVARAAQRALVVADLPFPYAQLGPDEAVRACAEILKQTNAAAVKIEGGEKRADVFRAVTDAGIPVMGHCGLMPQEIRKLGSYKVQRDESALRRDLAAIQESGAFAAILECVPQEIAARQTAELEIPTIGIGAGVGCDGQVLVFHDLLGYHLPERTAPKHARSYADLGTRILGAVRAFADDVRGGKFPSDAESF
ncbi:MAG: 3-methyl-2-oxobutanoate hydroxymethyltransferase [Thermoguttaceae bacterium]|jgi:3-methyl-2-oxobutanoate hydroxymethyltransferase